MQISPVKIFLTGSISIHIVNTMYLVVIIQSTYVIYPLIISLDISTYFLHTKYLIYLCILPTLHLIHFTFYIFYTLYTLYFIYIIFSILYIIFTLYTQVIYINIHTSLLHFYTQVIYINIHTSLLHFLYLGNLYNLDNLYKYIKSSFTFLHFS